MDGSIVTGYDVSSDLSHSSETEMVNTYSSASVTVSAISSPKVLFLSSAVKARMLPKNITDDSPSDKTY